MDQKENKERIDVFTDGSFSSLMPSVCGIGIYFPNGEFTNVSETFSVQPTNQRAELKAILRAIQIIRNNEKTKTKQIQIYTDSAYAIGACTEWLQKWKLNNWQTTKGTPVLNQDLLRPLSECLENVSFCHVRAHTSQTDVFSCGNREADKLAKEAIVKHPKKSISK